MDATMENKMGLPPPYEQMTNQPPPPSYFGSNPPPPPGLVVPPPTAPPRTSVITTPPANPSVTKLGPGRTGMTCPNCHKNIVTRIQYVPNNRTHIISAALCVFAGCICGCFIPYCMKSCKTANHYCSSCRAFIGTYIPS